MLTDLERGVLVSLVSLMGVVGLMFGASHYTLHNNNLEQEIKHKAEIHALYLDDKKNEIETNKKLRSLQVEATEKEVRKKEGMRG